MYNNKTSLNYCIGGILISHSFLPFPVLPGMLTVVVEVDYFELMMESAVGFPNTQYFFLLLECFLHLKV